MYHKYSSLVSSSDHSESNNPEMEESPFYWIHKVHSKQIIKLDKHLKKSGLDHLRRQIILILDSNDDLSISDLSKIITVKVPTITKAVYRLKDEDLVSIYTCPKDARVTRAKLTTNGKEMVNKINELTDVILSNSFDNLTVIQIKSTINVLKTIFKNLS